MCQLGLARLCYHGAAVRTARSRDTGTTPVAVAGKVIDLLEALAANGPLGLTAISSHTSINKASAFRILSTLEGRGYLEQDPVSRRYQPGPRLLGLALSLSSSLDIMKAARPELVSLAAEFGETVNLGVLSDGRVLYLDIVESRWSLRMAAQVGDRGPLHATALGKAMLARMPAAEVRHILGSKTWERFTPNTLVTLNALERDLERVRVRGYSLDNEENEHGARCVGVAVLGQGDRPIAAISVSGPAARIDSEQAARIGERLKLAAAKVEGKMGYVDRGQPGQRAQSVGS